MNIENGLFCAVPQAWRGQGHTSVHALVTLCDLCEPEVSRSHPPHSESFFNWYLFGLVPSDNFNSKKYSIKKRIIFLINFQDTFRVFQLGFQDFFHYSLEYCLRLKFVLSNTSTYFESFNLWSKEKSHSLIFCHEIWRLGIPSARHSNMADPPTVALTSVLTVTTQGARVWLPVTKTSNTENLDHQ